MVVTRLSIINLPIMQPPLKVMPMVLMERRTPLMMPMVDITMETMDIMLIEDIMLMDTTTLLDIVNMMLKVPMPPTMANTATLELTPTIKEPDTKRLTTTIRRPDTTMFWLTTVHTPPNMESMTSTPTTTKVPTIMPDMTSMDPTTDMELKPTVSTIMIMLPTDITTADTNRRCTSKDPDMDTNTRQFQLSDTMTRLQKRSLFSSSACYLFLFIMYKKL